MTRIVIVGLGLIGGSLALALKEKGQFCIGLDKDQTVLEKALVLKAIDESLTEIQSLGKTDIVIVATPFAALPKVFASLAGTPAILTDVSGVKAPVLDMARDTLGASASRFVPGHPMAGSERHGLDAAKTDLFRDRVCILTPTAETEQEAVDKVQALWHSIGAQVVFMDANAHDETMAWVSHLPHFLAFALAAAMPQAHFCLAGDSFKSATRVAKSDPEQWADLMLANADALLSAAQELSSNMEDLMEAIRHKDRKKLLQALQQAAKSSEAA